MSKNKTFIVKECKKCYTFTRKKGDKMAKKKVPKKAKRRLIVFGPIAIFIIFYCAFTLVTTTMDLYKLKNEEAELSEKLSTLKTDASDLKTEITKLQNKDYVARYARENYLYTKNGEYVIKTEEKTKTEKKETKKDETYIIYACIAATIFIILFIIIIHHRRKKKKSSK